MQKHAPTRVSVSAHVNSETWKDPIADNIFFYFQIKLLHSASDIAYLHSELRKCLPKYTTIWRTLILNLIVSDLILCWSCSVHIMQCVKYQWDWLKLQFIPSGGSSDTISTGKRWGAVMACTETCFISSPVTRLSCLSHLLGPNGSTKHVDVNE